MPEPHLVGLVKVLPKLKRPLQLAGLVVIVAGVIAYQQVPPEYIRGVFAAGSMGIFFLVFGQLFPALVNIPASHRAAVILVALVIFSLFTLSAIALIAYTVIKVDGPSLSLRKIGHFVRPASEIELDALVKWVRDKKNCDFKVIDLQEADLFLETIRKSKIASANDVEFLRDWTQESHELKDTLCRLIGVYADGTLLASDFSRAYEKKIHEDIKRSGGTAIYSGDQAFDALEAIMQSGETDSNTILRYVALATSNFITVGYSALYARFRYIPKIYADSVDPDFLTFIKNIPDDHWTLVREVGFPDAPSRFLMFECGSPATSDRPYGSYSRFMVPVKSVERRDVVERMANGPWPVGSARELFSESWWLSNAIWQMLAREHRRYRTQLGIRISDFDRCGPP